MKKQQLLICPVCSATWKELPLLSIHHKPEIKKVDEKLKELSKIKNLRIYNDDEPLMSPSSVKVSNHVKVNAKNVEVSLLPDSALLTVGRSSQTQVVVLKVKAPPPSAARRLPIDLVTVLDVSEMICRVKSQMMKRVMRLLISSLNSNDRLSIVVFSATSKRLLPLRRMTAEGRRSARRIVEALQSTGRGMSAHDGLKKAAKVIEDRREKNPVASIIIISNGQDDRSYANSFAQKRSSRMVSSTRFSHLEIPVHSIGLGDISACKNSPPADALAKCARFIHSLVGPVHLEPVRSGSGISTPRKRELLVEMKVPTSCIGSHHVLSVQSSFKDPSSQEPIFSKEKALLIPRPQTVRSSVPNIQRLKDLHITTRAIAESQRLTDHSDLSGAYHLLSSARALVMQSSDGSTIEHLRSLEAELGELHRRRLQLVQSQKQKSSQQAEEKPEPLTPTSAWRAAERLAKVAIMRKHMNRVSDLHGFENARF
ncbi:hypothetical protein GH714_016457 [Hevea brasiliensis]|uniref:VWFA domain-containing protein n=1 Tax=Hevea brasiliensis TaxID=3981 RepID=A0A6A6K5N8_HEVBR|nr:hypothetical protein GH714_016457 [Hevea brasiliensis]